MNSSDEDKPSLSRRRFQQMLIASTINLGELIAAKGAQFRPAEHKFEPWDGAEFTL